MQIDDAVEKLNEMLTKEDLFVISYKKHDENSTLFIVKSRIFLTTEHRLQISNHFSNLSLELAVESLRKASYKKPILA